MSLEQTIETRQARVGVIGLGYVGLPLAVAVAHADLAQVGSRFSLTTDFSGLADCDVIVICVPTPLTRQREPDFSFVEQTARQIAAHMSPDTPVVLESTTWPGTTQEALVPILESSGLEKDAGFFVGFSPERGDPGNARFRTQTIPKIWQGTAPVWARLWRPWCGCPTRRPPRRSRSPRISFARSISRSSTS